MNDISDSELEGMQIEIPRWVDATKVPGPLLLNEARLLLTNHYLPMEMGCALNSDGMQHIAVSTFMPNVTGAMIDWWFGWVTTTEQYKMWHPKDHVYSERSGPQGNSTYIGGYHLVKEWLGEDCHHIRIAFKDPSVYFGPSWKSEFERNGYETAICGRIGVWGGPGIEAAEMGHVIHLVRKEFNGCRMRSRFWLGDLLGIELPDIRARTVAEDLAQGLVQHTHEEMATLASFLPELYRKETGEAENGAGP